MTNLSATSISFVANGARILSDISVEFSPGSFTAVIGPNGAGKTSLLRILAGLSAPTTGAVWLDNVPLSKMPLSDRALKTGYLPQKQSLAWPMDVQNIIALGRFANGATPDRLSANDAAAIHDAMTSTGCAHLAKRAATTLSGGEMARVYLARLIAGQTDIILADEPIAALDPRHQRDTLALFGNLANRGATIILVLHDLALAAQYADRLLWMKDGVIMADGSPKQTLTQDRLSHIFGLDAAESVMLLGPALAD
jgi:iron complex transport system ATP-binding protein